MTNVQFDEYINNLIDNKLAILETEINDKIIRVENAIDEFKRLDYSDRNKIRWCNQYINSLIGKKDKQYEEILGINERFINLYKKIDDVQKDQEYLNIKFKKMIQNNKPEETNERLINLDNKINTVVKNFTSFKLGLADITEKIEKVLIFKKQLKSTYQSFDDD